MLLHIDVAGAQGLRNALGRGQLNGAALVSFTQQLATLLGAGQPLERSLGILLKQPGQPQTRALIERIRERVKAGQPLSKALEEEGSQLLAAVPEHGACWRGGRCPGNTLRQLSDYLERSQLLRGEVINALIYPAFLVVGVLGSLALLLAYVVPQFVPIFKDLGVPIPLITEVILESRPIPGCLRLGGVGRVDRDDLDLVARLRDPRRRERSIAACWAFA